MKHPAASETDPFAVLKQGVRWLWSLGDYTALAPLLEPAAMRLAADLDLHAGIEVLDVAAGNGNFALAAAARGACVAACDLAPAMVELGRARTATSQVGVDWREADVEALPFEPESFDVVASVFGAMFAPRPRETAVEMFRVARRDGVVAMANYTDSGFLGRFAELLARYSNPSPFDLPSPFSWGDEAEVRRRFDGLARSIEVTPATITFRFASLDDGHATWERINPPHAALRGMLPADRYARFMDEAREVMRELNSAVDGGLVLESGYVTVVARK